MSRHHDNLNRKKWARLRRLVLDRSGYRCQTCGRAGRLEVDHVKPLDAGGDLYDLDNLQSLCRGCHILKTAQENRTPRSARQAAWDRYIASI